MIFFENNILYLYFHIWFNRIFDNISYIILYIILHLVFVIITIIIRYHFVWSTMFLKSYSIIPEFFFNMSNHECWKNHLSIIIRFLLAKFLYEYTTLAHVQIMLDCDKLVGGWTTRLKTMRVKLDRLPKDRGKNSILWLTHFETTTE